MGEANFYYLLDLERTIIFEKPFYWRANKHGYTCYIDEAGLFSFEIANEIVLNDLDNRTVMIDEKVVEKILKEV